MRHDPVQARLDAIAGRASKATPGPWTWTPKAGEGWGHKGPDLVNAETLARWRAFWDANPQGGLGQPGIPMTVIESWGHDADGIDVSHTDAAFIAAARADVSALLDLLRAAMALADQVAAKFDWSTCDDYRAARASFGAEPR